MSFLSAKLLKDVGNPKILGNSSVTLNLDGMHEQMLWKCTNWLFSQMTAGKHEGETALESRTPADPDPTFSRNLCFPPSSFFHLLIRPG